MISETIQKQKGEKEQMERNSPLLEPVPLVLPGTL